MTASLKSGVKVNAKQDKPTWRGRRHAKVTMTFCCPRLVAP